MRWVVLFSVAALSMVSLNWANQKALSSKSTDREIASLARLIQVFPTTTPDSTLTSHGNVPADAHWIMAVAQKTGSPNERKSVVSYSGGPYSQRIYLIDGPGEYTLDFYFSASEQQAGTYKQFAASVKIQNTDPRDLSYLTATADIQSDDPEILILAQAITHGLQTDREKSQTIHDWITTNISYDIEALSNPLLPADAHYTLEKRKSVCQGYANLNAALHRAVGIRAKVIQGSAKQIMRSSSQDRPLGGTLASESPPSCDQLNHAWNEIFIDGQWLTQDATWDSGYLLAGTRQFVRSVSHRYLFPDPSVFLRDHMACFESQQN